MNITKIAQEHFVKLLSKEPVNTGIRIVVSNAGTLSARCGICFIYGSSSKFSDTVLNFDLLSVRVESRVLPFLREAIIDYVLDGLDFRLVFKAPYAKGFLNVVGIVKENADYLFLQDRIKDVLELQINPQLAAHGGSVSLVDVTKDFVVILKFLGGCNGCAMANYTMRLGIEATLKELFPGLKGVRDATEHYRGKHSYY